MTSILLDLRQQACVEFRQSDENLDCASDAQELCGIALILIEAVILAALFFCGAVYLLTYHLHHGNI